MEENRLENVTEQKTRERVYNFLLPFLGAHAHEANACISATSYVEERFNELNRHFSKIRKDIENKRRIKYRNKNQKRN